MRQSCSLSRCVTGDNPELKLGNARFPDSCEEAARFVRTHGGRSGAKSAQAQLSALEHERPGWLRRREALKRAARKLGPPLWAKNSRQKTNQLTRSLDQSGEIRARVRYGRLDSANSSSLVIVACAPLAAPRKQIPFASTLTKNSQHNRLAERARKRHLKGPITWVALTTTARKEFHLLFKQKFVPANDEAISRTREEQLAVSKLRQLDSD